MQMNFAVRRRISRMSLKKLWAFASLLHCFTGSLVQGWVKTCGEVLFLQNELSLALQQTISRLNKTKVGSNETKIRLYETKIGLT